MRSASQREEAQQVALRLEPYRKVETSPSDGDKTSEDERLDCSELRPRRTAWKVARKLEPLTACCLLEVKASAVDKERRVSTRKLEMALGGLASETQATRFKG